MNNGRPSRGGRPMPPPPLRGAPMVPPSRSRPAIPPSPPKSLSGPPRSASSVDVQPRTGSSPIPARGIGVQRGAPPVPVPRRQLMSGIAPPNGAPPKPALVPRTGPVAATVTAPPILGGFAVPSGTPPKPAAATVTAPPMLGGFVPPPGVPPTSAPATVTAPPMLAGFAPPPGSPPKSSAPAEVAPPPMLAGFAPPPGSPPKSSAPAEVAPPPMLAGFAPPPMLAGFAPPPGSPPKSSAPAEVAPPPGSLPSSAPVAVAAPPSMLGFSPVGGSPPSSAPVAVSAPPSMLGFSPVGGSPPSSAPVAVSAPPSMLGFSPVGGSPPSSAPVAVSAPPPMLGFSPVGGSPPSSAPVAAPSRMLSSVQSGVVRTAPLSVPPPSGTKSAPGLAQPRSQFALSQSFSLGQLKEVVDSKGEKMTPDPSVDSPQKIDQPGFEIVSPVVPPTPEVESIEEQEDTDFLTDAERALIAKRKEEEKLSAETDPFKIKGKGKLTPLMQAIRDGKEKTLLKMISGGANLNEPDDAGRYPVHAAVYNYKMMKILVSRGANINQKNALGNTPLHEACLHSQQATIGVLLQSDAILTVVKNNEGLMPINLPPFNIPSLPAKQLKDDPRELEHKFRWMMIGLLDPKLGSKVEGWKGTERKDTPLHKALEKDRNVPAQIKAIKQLMKKGSISDWINAKNPQSETPLHIACASKNYWAVSLFLNEGALAAEVDVKGNTPLHMAASVADLDTISLLLTQPGVRCDIANKEGRYPPDMNVLFHSAVKRLVDQCEASLRGVFEGLLKIDPKGTVTITPIRGKKLLDSKEARSSSPFLVISYDNHQHTTPKIEDDANPQWEGIEWTFEVYSPQTPFTISAYGFVDLAEDDFLGMVSCSVASLGPKDAKGRAYRLLDRKGNKMIGELLLSVKYAPYEIDEDAVTGQTLAMYEPMIDVLMKNDYELVAQTSVVCKPNDEFARALVNILSAKNEAENVLMRVIGHEIEGSEHEAQLFRLDSWATKMMKSYCRKIGVAYLANTLGGFISRICEEPGHYEVDPLRLKPDENMEVNLTNLRGYVEEVFASITSSAVACPLPLRRTFRFVASAVRAKFPASVNRAIGGFVFLRYLCAALAATPIFGIRSSLPPEASQRCLVLVAKVLQNSANGVLFGFKEPNLIPLNDVVELNHARLSKFYEDLCDVPEGVEETPKAQDTFTLKDLAVAHLHFMKNMKALSTVMNLDALIASAVTQ